MTVLQGKIRQIQHQFRHLIVNHCSEITPLRKLAIYLVTSKHTGTLCFTTTTKETSFSVKLTRFMANTKT